MLISGSFGQTLRHKAVKPANPRRRLSRHLGAQSCKMRPLLLLFFFFFSPSYRCDRVSLLSLPLNWISRGGGRWLRHRTFFTSLAAAEPLVFSLHRDVRSRFKASGLKYNLDLGAANHKSPMGNNTRSGERGRGRGQSARRSYDKYMKCNGYIQSLRWETVF